MEVNFEKMCRICLDANKETYDIFKSYYSKRNYPHTLYSEMITSCTKHQVSEEDGLPRQICKECSRHLKKAYAFNLMYETSYKKLKLYFDNKLDSKDLKIEYVPDLKADLETDEQLNFDIDETSLGHETEKNVRQLKEEVKVEPINFDNDDFWDAEDDTVLCDVIDSSPAGDLLQIKHEEILENFEIEDKPKNKRGRKKKEYVNSVKPKSESKGPHQCHICGKILSTRSNLKAHNLCHTDLRPYKCETCQATFRGYSALFHHKRTHTKETPFHCEYCPKQFSRRSNLVDHIRMHMGEKSFHCSICCKKFTQRAQLAIHLKRHKGDKSYLCQDCGKGFPVKADLKVHQRIHNGEKPYACHLCTKTFATSGNLSIHVRIHKKEIRYTCGVCNRGFVTSSSYNVHLKRHKGQRDYHCYCGKTFFTSSALKQHKVTHTGEKKYQCKICDRKFSQTSHLNRHFKKDHAKLNDPLPSSDQYRIVLKDVNSTVLTVINNSEIDNVKCEGN